MDEWAEAGAKRISVAVLQAGIGDWVVPPHMREKKEDLLWETGV